MAKTATVLAALRRFLPPFLEAAPPLSAEQRRALWALTHCRTPALGGRAFGCKSCGQVHFAYHSCNHKACPQCGAQPTARWIQRELRKQVNAPCVQLHSGRVVDLGATAVPAPTPSAAPACPHCGRPTHWLFSLAPAYAIRGPPVTPPSTTSPPVAL